MRARVFTRALLLLAVSLLAASSVQAAAPTPHAPKRAGFLGVATVGGAPVVGGRLEVLTRGGHPLRLARTVRTNRRGGFRTGVHGLKRSFVGRASGGTVGGVRFRQSLYALADARERGVVVNSVTTVAVACSRRHPRVSMRAAAGRIRALLGLPALVGGTMALGQAAGVESNAFSPKRFRPLRAVRAGSTGSPGGWPASPPTRGRGAASGPAPPRPPRQRARPADPPLTARPWRPPASWRACSRASSTPRAVASRDRRCRAT
jgi:hypothetical protein